MGNTPARRVILALSVGAFLSAALSVARLSPRLPYGAFGPWAFGLLVAAALALLALLIRDQHYAWSLGRGEILRMAQDGIPTESDQTFLGYGFDWTPAHAERLYKAAAETQPSPRLLEVQKRIGGNPLLHGLGAPREQSLFLENRRLPQHMLVLGSPGEGKSRFLELLLWQVIRSGDIAVILDPKGDSRLIDVAVQAARENGRGDAFRLVAPPWPKASACYNPLANFGSPSEIADRLMGIFPPARGDDEAFRGFQWAAVAAVAQGLYIAGLPMTIARILRYLRNLQELFFEVVQRKFPDLASEGLARAARRYQTQVASGSFARRPELDDLLHYIDLDPTYYGKMTGSLVPQLERLASGIKRDLLSPEPESAQKPILTWPAAVNQGSVVYFFLGSLHGEESAKALGKMILLDLQAYLASRYSYHPGGRERRIVLFIDEAHHMISKPFLNILAEGRGANVASILATQTTAQFEEALGSRAAVDEVLTNTHAQIHFQSRNPRETRDFSDLVGKRRLRVIGEAHRYEAGFFGSGLKTIDDFRACYTQSFAWQDADLLPAWAVTQLPTFHFFARVGGRVLKGRIPLLDPPTSDFAREVMEKGADPCI
jgi:conjugal transfer pilus assembly protein TraD